MCRMTQQHWTIDQVPDQTGRLFVVTGAASGLGLATTRGRRPPRRAGDPRRARRRGRAAGVAAITAEHPGAQLEVRHLDLADLDSVGAFAARMRAEHDRVDVLVNNAGVLARPAR